MTLDEFRVNHRAASESLMRAAVSDGFDDINDQLERATYFETQALEHIATPRQRALAMGLMHSIDLIRAVADAEFRR